MKKNIKKYKNKVFSDNFTNLMFVNKLTLKEISEKTSLPLSTLSTWKRGRVPRNKQSLQTLANIFDVTTNELTKQKSGTIIFSNTNMNNDNDYSSLILKHIHKLLQNTSVLQQRIIYKKLQKYFPIKNK
ncbi:MAG: helix-turn-helix transcriptional regulator [Opitutales bacterium]|nr:helix-turn-helix transcriptional regulator [Opitutales bacterium]